MARSAETSAILKELGRRIAVFRRTAGLSQEGAAAAAGIDYKRWQRLEEGSVNPTVRTLVRVAGVVGVSVWTLCGPTPPPEGDSDGGRRNGGLPP